MEEHQTESIEAVEEETQNDTDEPPMFRVLLHNDDYTPRDFVVEVLVVIFHKARTEATDLMWRIHRGGQGVVGVYPHEIAEAKVAAVTAVSRDQGFPLKASLRPDT